MAQSPENLLAKLTTVRITDNSFKNDSGETIKYQRLVLGIEIKEEALEVEFKIDKKDATLLAFADVINPELVSAE